MGGYGQIREFKIVLRKYYSQMAKRRREISLDSDIIKVVEEKTEKGEICLSRFVNNTLREKYKNDLKTVKKS